MQPVEFNHFQRGITWNFLHEDKGTYINSSGSNFLPDNNSLARY